MIFFYLVLNLEGCLLMHGELSLTPSLEEWWHQKRLKVNKGEVFKFNWNIYLFFYFILFIYFFGDICISFCCCCCCFQGKISFRPYWPSSLFLHIVLLLFLDICILVYMEIKLWVEKKNYAKTGDWYSWSTDAIEGTAFCLLLFK